MMNYFLSIVLLLSSMILCLSYLNINNNFRQKNCLLKLNSGGNDGIYPSTYVYSSDLSLADALCEELLLLGKKYISMNGVFNVAVPGGSVLKMLTNLKSSSKELDWSKVNWFYVNHKCVPNTDETSTHFKAQKYFLKELYNDNIANNVVSVELDVVTGHDSVAHKYEKRMKEILPSINNLPVIDMMIIGVGKDGHCGSLYPNRKEVTSSTLNWVLTVDKKLPPSITLSLPVMNNANNIRVVLAGQDKSEACYYGVARKQSLSEFPAGGISDKAIWMIDEPASTHLTENKIPFINK